MFLTTTRKRRGYFWIAGAVALMAVYWWHSQGAAGGPDAGKKGKKDSPVAVLSEIAKQQDVPEELRLSGFVIARNQVEVRPQLISVVREIAVREGQAVTKGQLLFLLDDQGATADAGKLAAQSARDQAVLDNTRRNLLRYQSLFAQQIVSQQELDTAQNAVDVALATVNADQAALHSGQVTVAYHRLIAPQAGRVGEIPVRIGSLVQPGATQPMTTITGIDPVDVAFNVPESQVQNLLAAQRQGPVTVSVTQAGVRLDGQLSFVDSVIDAATGSLKAKASFHNPESRLWPGAMVEVVLTLQTLKDAVTVSPQAVQVGPTGQFVYLIAADGKVSARPVSIRYLTASLAVVQGLEPGSRVVQEGGQNLRAGMRVKDAAAQPKKNGKHAGSAS